MKNRNTLMLIALFLTSTLAVRAQVAINQDGSTPDVTAMLDVKSNDKGMLVPRMTTNHRTTIYTPANGLLVFDTDTKTFWYYDTVSAAWKEIVSSINNNLISDMDGDTKIQLEKAMDEDIIRFDIAGTEFLVLDNGRIHTPNTGQSVFLGEGAGEFDDLTNNENAFIGYHAGYKNTSGFQNTAMGYFALENGSETRDNSAFGAFALQWITSGIANTAMGAFSLRYDSSGSYNTAVGYNGLNNNLTGIENTAVGAAALQQNTTGTNNTALGQAALRENINGNYNTAVGSGALFSTTTGGVNTAIGFYSLSSDTSGDGNIAIGPYALADNSNGSWNVAIGYRAGLSDTGSNNIFLGTGAGLNETGSDKLYIESSSSSTPLIWGDFLNDSVKINGVLGIKDQYVFPVTDGSASQAMVTDGSGSLSWNDLSINGLSDGRTTGYSVFLGEMAGKSDDGNFRSNTAVGDQAMENTTTGTQNVAVGRYALQDNVSGKSSVAIGYASLSGSTGFGQVAIGNGALQSNSSGSYNTAVGHWAGGSNTSGSGNIFLGFQAGWLEKGSNKLYIANSNTADPLIYGEFDNALLTINGRLGVGTNAAAETKLRVSHDSLYAGSFTTNFGNANTIVLSAEFTGTGIYDATAVYGKSTPDPNSNYGFGGDFLGNYMGVRANADAGSSSGTAYGLYGRSNGTAGTRYGVFGWAESGGTRYGVYGKATAQTDSYGIYCDGNGVYTGTWSQTSDKKLKKNIEPLQGALEKLLQLSPKTYEYRTSEYEFMNLAQGAQIGFVAQDVETVFPELVSTVSHPKSQGKSSDYEEYKAINYIALIPVLTEAIQEQQQQIEQQKQQIDALLKRLEELEKVKGTVR